VLASRSTTFNPREKDPEVLLILILITIYSPLGIYEAHGGRFRPIEEEMTLHLPPYDVFLFQA
jgi:hypothetical protein